MGRTRTCTVRQKDKQTDRQIDSHVPSEIRSREWEGVKTRSILDKQNMCLNKQMQSSVILESNVRNLAQIQNNKLIEENAYTNEIKSIF